MVCASRWSVALRTFYRQMLSLLYSSFFSETSAPGSPGNYLYIVILSCNVMECNNVMSCHAVSWNVCIFYIRTHHICRFCTNSWVQPGSTSAQHLFHAPILLMAEIWRSPVEVGSLSHYLQRLSAPSQVVIFYISPDFSHLFPRLPWTWLAPVGWLLKTLAPSHKRTSFPKWNLQVWNLNKKNMVNLQSPFV